MKNFKYAFVVFLLGSLSFSSSNAQDAAWVSLFNGENFDNFKQLNGKASYKIEGSTIVGISKLDTPNSFLTTKERYSDFILEFEVQIDSSLNSGVQIRSNSTSDYLDGRVHGYQVEIDPSPRAFSGGIYDEGRRGWLYPLTQNPKGRTAFRNGKWNAFHVEAIGNSIKTWINGVQCTHLIDDLTAEGFIGLQVHAIGKKEQEGKAIRWRNLRILTEDIEQHAWENDTEVPQLSYLINQLSEWETTQNWQLLWDGKTTTGWRGAALDHFPESGWQMKDGVLTILATNGAEAKGPGDIITEAQFSNFELELEFKITEGANSGIKYFVQPTLNKGLGSAIGCEFQILDDVRHPDAKKGMQGNRTISSLYDLIPAENVSIPDRGKQFKGIGNWNKARIVVRGGKVEHWLNNEQVIEYDRWSQLFRALVAHSKYKHWENFGQWQEGHILLQDHGDTVHFRSIKIREF